jgi:hypothetical protein
MPIGSPPDSEPSMRRPLRSRHRAFSVEDLLKKDAAVGTDQMTRLVAVVGARATETTAHGFLWSARPILLMVSLGLCGNLARHSLVPGVGGSHPSAGLNDATAETERLPRMPDQRPTWPPYRRQIELTSRRYSAEPRRAAGEFF